MKRPEPDLDALREALTAASYSYCSGGTHGFYHYPARFAPPIARAVIEEFSRDDDVVLDPFLGGGTTLIEGLQLGRRIVGSDINALAHFVSSTRTTPLSGADAEEVRVWAAECAEAFGGRAPQTPELPNIVNLPKAVEIFIAGSLERSEALTFPRQRAFARCALLRLGQWVLDCRDFVKPHRSRLARRLPELVNEMLAGLDEFVADCAQAGVAKHAITGRRVLLHRSAVGLHEDDRVRSLGSRPRLVFTSPPYPSVHVLYHRWQYRGRRETPAPYWIAKVPDGYYESYYTGGSRTPSGRKHYFAMIEGAFRSVRRIIHPDAWVIQLVGFFDMESQLPLYLAAMAAAGFKESLPTGTGERLDRRVPNRKWYAKLQGTADASTEILLFHRRAE